VALSAHLDRWEQGAGAANKLGEADVGRRLKARGAVDPAARVAALSGAEDPLTRLALGRALLAAGQAKEARAVADALVKADAWWPEALALQSASLAALGLSQQAGEAAARLARVDPLYPSDTIVAAGAAP
jgi:tetratricopeptide (TPR) repeat protein